MKGYYVYIIKCADNSYYTGVTRDLLQRLQQHQSGYNSKSYTYNRRPVRLVYYSVFSDINDAILFEKQIKGWSRKKKEALIDGNFDKLKELSICMNNTHFINYQKDKEGFDSAQPDNFAE